MAWWLFQNVVITAGLAVAIAMVCRTIRIGPVARHALWLVVLVKFVTPPLVVWPWVAPDPLRFSTLGIQVDDRHDGHAPVGFTDSEPALTIDATGTSAGGSDRTADAWSGSSPARVFAIAWPWLVGMWLAGGLGLFGIEGVRLVRLSRRVRRGRPADAALEKRVAALCARLQIQPVPVRVVTGDAPPAVWCFGRPRVLWPEDLGPEPTDLCIDAVLLHELAHVKRRDYIVGWLELVAGIVWWWNPCFWFVRSALREQAELACDVWVISTLPNGRRAYAESLLTLSGAAPRGHLSMAVVGVRASSRRALERRLAMIMKGRAPLRLPRVGLLSLAFAAALVLPGWAAPQDPPPPPPPPPPVRVQAPKPPAPPPPARRVQAAPRKMPPAPPPSLQLSLKRFNFSRTSLPADGQELLKGFNADVDAIQREADQKTAARREALVKELEALQAEHTKAGRLDEAIAIRDFLRAGLPGSYFRYVIRRQDGGR